MIIIWVVATATAKVTTSIDEFEANNRKSNNSNNNNNNNKMIIIIFGSNYQHNTGLSIFLFLEARLKNISTSANPG